MRYYASLNTDSGNFNNEKIMAIKVDQKRSNADLEQAENAVLAAIRSFASNNGLVANSLTVPQEAENILRRQAEGKLTVTDANIQITAAINRLSQDQRIDAPIERYKEWVIL
jgi:hypothetical protein